MPSIIYALQHTSFNLIQPLCIQCYFFTYQLLYSNSTVSLTQNNNSLSKREGASQVSRRRQFPQWPIFAALVRLSWLVVLNENLEKSVSVIIFFVITLFAFLYLLVQLIIMIRYVFLLIISLRYNREK